MAPSRSTWRRHAPKETDFYRTRHFFAASCHAAVFRSRRRAAAVLETLEIFVSGKIGACSGWLVSRSTNTEI